MSYLPQTLSKDEKLIKQIKFGQKQAQLQDQTEVIVKLTEKFNYDECKDEYWNPEEFSFLYGTALWEKASSEQRKILNQLYWVAYYSQIVSAEITTIYFNQIAAAGLFSIEDFSILCDLLDVESRQERIHIQAFRNISAQFEKKVFGELIFTPAMKGIFQNTTIHEDSNRLLVFYRNLQLYGYTILASSRAYLSAQYLLVRAIRTLNGKIIQGQLSKHLDSYADELTAPIPSRISRHHFIDESFHFNTSKLIGLDLGEYIPKPNTFDKWILNQLITGSQKDHKSFSVTVNGIFWYDPALFQKVYKILCSKAFLMDKKEALDIMEKSFCFESDGLYSAYKTYQVVKNSYIQLIEPVQYLNDQNRKMHILEKNTLKKQLNKNKYAFQKFKKEMLLIQ